MVSAIVVVGATVVVLAARWYFRSGLSYRDVEELLAERGIEVVHVTIYRWVQRFTLLVIDAARPCRRSVGDRWFVDETSVKVAGVWRSVYRAIDQRGEVIEILGSERRGSVAARLRPAPRHDAISEQSNRVRSRTAHGETRPLRTRRLDLTARQTPIIRRASSGGAPRSEGLVRLSGSRHTPRERRGR
jgi:transposase-like protein